MTNHQSPKIDQTFPPYNYKNEIWISKCYGFDSITERGLEEIPTENKAPMVKRSTKRTRLRWSLAEAEGRYHVPLLQKHKTTPSSMSSPSQDQNNCF